MNAETKKALEKSIAHWERMREDRDGVTESPHGDDCALCDAFYINDCEGCPVYTMTYIRACRDTPWESANQMHRDGDEDQWKYAADKMIRFLKDLLPKEEAHNESDV